jgi:hypothetical protein
MESTEVVGILREAVASCAKFEGWANLAEVGVVLKEKGINYGKLSKFINRFPEEVEIRIDDQKQPPVAYARLKNSEEDLGQE